MSTNHPSMQVSLRKEVFWLQWGYLVKYNNKLNKMLLNAPICCCGVWCDVPCGLSGLRQTAAGRQESRQDKSLFHNYPKMAASPFPSLQGTCCSAITELYSENILLAYAPTFFNWGAHVLLVRKVSVEPCIMRHYSWQSGEREWRRLREGGREGERGKKTGSWKGGVEEGERELARNANLT